jgi:aspartyl-tRNA(Asn)/glutamyl-tRNA(Gln) amidotransferase subunit B
MLRALDISDANMEEGQMRCDVNISLECRKSGEQANRVEIKNVLGIRFVEKVIEHEIKR